MKKIKALLLLFLCVSLVNVNANERVNQENNVIQNDLIQNNKTLEYFLTTLQIKQGIASFIQKKHFTFLNKPIVSKGLLKIYQSSVIWQVNTPVFSKLVIVEDQIWQLVNPDSSQSKTPNHYKNVVSHASIETLIRAVFTGEINRAQWNILLNEQQCLQLTPKDLILSQAIKEINVCVPDTPNQRFVTLTDAQSNLTEIELNIITNQLSDEDIREFNINK
jgi:hypothetical protein